MSKKVNKFNVVDGHILNEYKECSEQSNDLESWWSLSYAQFLTIPRVAMQSMPTVWQDKMAALLNELDARIDWRLKKGTYHVQKNMAPDEYDSNLGRYPDPVLVLVTQAECNYRHGRMFLKPPAPPTAEEHKLVDDILKGD